MVYSVRQIGAKNTLDYKAYIEQDGKVISSFHDVPPYADKENNIFNMIVEIPRWTNAKLEISKELPMNPSIQDTKKGELRYARNCFPHHGYIHNYGASPQAREGPNEIHPETRAIGDNDPLDVLEIGEIKRVNVLGIMALLDEGETDWKVVTVDIRDPLAPKLNK